MEVTDTPKISDKRVKQLLVRVGDQGQEHAVNNLRKLLEESSEVYTEFKSLIIDTLVDCISLVPGKAAIYATYVAALTGPQPELVEEVCKRCVENLQSALDEGEILRAKMLLKFLIELSNAEVLNQQTLLKLVESLVSECEKTIETSHDYYLAIILPCIPLLCYSLPERAEAQFNNLIEQLEGIVSGRKKFWHEAIRVLRDDNMDDTIDEVWSVVKLLGSQGWKYDSEFHPYAEFIEEIRQHKVVISELPAITFENKVVKLCTYQACLVFEMFDQNDILEQVPNKLERILMKEMITDSISAFQHCQRLAAEKVLYQSYPHTATMTIVTCTFAQLFGLPTTECRDIFYASMLVSMCKAKDSEEVAKAIAKAFNILFDKLDQMDSEIAERFTNCFAYFLNNMDMSWSWEEWVSALELPRVHPKVIFLKRVIQKLVNLSYVGQIKKKLPEEFHDLVPAERSNTFPYEHESDDNHADAQLLLDKIKQKVPGDVFFAGEEFQTKEDDTLNEIFVFCLLHAGRKTITHISTLLDRYRDLLQSRLSTGSQREMVVGRVIRYWQNCDNLKILILGKMLDYEIIDASALITWVFKSVATLSEIEIQSEMIYWEILFATIQKLLSTSDLLKTELRRQEQMGEDGNENNSATINQLAVKLESKMAYEKSRFLQVFQGFADILQQLTSKQESFASVLARLLQVGRKYKKDFQSYMEEVESIFEASEDEKMTRVVELINAIY